MSRTTRFAPSPTGPLHLGHAYSALVAERRAREAGGRFLLRIDDLDGARSKPEWEAAITDDLAWLGLRWDGLSHQSDHFGAYGDAIDRLVARGLVYPCSCRRRDILAAAAAAHEGEPPAGPDGIVYPGTCRGRPMASRREDDALRLDLARALDGDPPGFEDTGTEHPGLHPVTRADLIATVGDPVLARPGLPAAYNFAVVIDDAATGVTEVTRGADLFAATFLQRAYQHLLGLPLTTYHHHRLVRDDAGRRLAKRDDARSLATYRAGGVTPEALRALVGL